MLLQWWRFRLQDGTSSRFPSSSMQLGGSRKPWVFTPSLRGWEPPPKWRTTFLEMVNASFFYMNFTRKLKTFWEFETHFSGAKSISVFFFFFFSGLELLSIASKSKVKRDRIQQLQKYHRIVTNLKFIISTFRPGTPLKLTMSMKAFTKKSFQQSATKNTFLVVRSSIEVLFRMDSAKKTWCHP